MARVETYWLLPTLRVTWVCLRRCIQVVRVVEGVERWKVWRVTPWWMTVFSWRFVAST